LDSHQLNCATNHIRARHRMQSLRTAAAFVSLVRFTSAAFVLNPYVPLSTGFNSLITRKFVPTSLAARGRNKKSLSKKGNAMKGVKKENLPIKICVICNRPFTWRKKWEKCWDEVTTCSKKCNGMRRQRKQEERRETMADSNSREHQKIDYDIDDNSSIKVDTRSMVNQITEAQHVSLDIQMEGHPTVADYNSEVLDVNTRRKAERKSAKKVRKAERRAQREGNGDPLTGSKECNMCGKPVNLLIRCKHGESNHKWVMICGKCWKIASGGVVDGDSDHPDYQYGGLWKNRRQQKS